MDLSKLHPPAAGPVLERDRLLNQLLAWEDRKLVVIHGPAGQGKSTLAAAYAKITAAPLAWYTLGCEDEDPLEFLSGLAEALSRVLRIAAPPLPSLPRYRYGMADFRTVVSRWFRGLFALHPGDCRIVLDDLHLIADASGTRELIQALLSDSPASVRFTLLSRTRPDLDTARVRAQRSFGELSGEDLRFIDGEAHRLFNEIFGMALAEEDAEALNRLAEGWPVGLVLMHEYLAASRTSPAALLSEQDRSPAVTSHIFDYLAQEVFDRLPQDLRGFLLRSSIVDHLTPALLNALCDPCARPAAVSRPVRALYDELLRRNLFVTTVDENTPVVRYHALVREFLLRKLGEEVSPAERKRLSTRAARYFQAQGDPVRAISLYLSSGQAEQAVGLIETAGPELLETGRTRTLLGLLDALPEPLHGRPWAAALRGIALRFTDPRSALALFEQALAGFRRARSSARRRDGQMLCLSGIIEACFHSGGDLVRMERSAAQADRLLRTCRGSAADSRARLLLAAGIARFFIGRLQESRDLLTRAAEAFRKSGDSFSQIQCAIYLTPCAVYLGEFGLARDAVSQGADALARIPQEKGGEAALHTVRAMIALNEGDFDEAKECVERCSALAKEYGLEAVDFLSLTIGGWLRMAVGEHDPANQLFAACKRKGKALGNEFFLASAAHFFALTALHRGRPAIARTEIDAALRVKPWSGSALFRAISIGIRGAVLLKQGDLVGAGKDLVRARKVLHAIGAAQQEANVLLLLAARALRLEREQEARDLLAAGFGIGQERSFTYYGTIAPEDLAALAEEALARDICPEHCAALLDDHLRKRIAPLVRIETFGGFAVRRGTRLITDALWKSRRAKSFVKLLAAMDPRPLNRDQAVDILWPSDGARDNHQSFISLLHRVRKALGPVSAAAARTGVISLEDDRLSLNRSLVWTDTAAFQSHLKAAERLAANRDTEAALREYHKAFDLYRGDFLPDDLYDDWTAAHRERLRSLYHKALDSAALLTERVKGKGGAVVYYERLFRSDLCNEKACRWLMAHHVAAGKRNDAVRAFEQCQRALDRDLEAEPEEETRKLYRRIIGG